MSAKYINPKLPGMIRDLHKGDPSMNSVKMMLALAGDLVQELIDLRAALAEQEETEWEYIAQFGHVQGEERITAEAAIQSAREVLDDYPLDFPESELPLQVLRRPLVGWLPVPDTTNNESEDKR